MKLKMNFTGKGKIVSLLAAMAVLLSVWVSPINAQSMKKSTKMVKNQLGSVYIQTNGIKNEIIHYARLKDGKLVEMNRIATGGAGSGLFKPITGKENEPNAFEGVGSIIISPDRMWLFTTNGGDNSVSSFKIGENGTLELMDMKPTGQPVRGKSGTAKSLAYSTKTNTLYVCHSFGPDHIRMFSVKEGKLTSKGGSHTVNTKNKTDRVATQIVLTPDQNYLMTDILFDKRPGMKPDGSPDLAVANMVDKDGLVIFSVKADGDLGEPTFNDGGGGAPFVIKFLNGSSDTFINGLAAGNGLVMGKIDGNGKVTNSPIVKLDDSKGNPSELCWIAITPDNKQIFAAVFGYSYVTSYKLENGKLEIAKDPASKTVPGDGKFKALDMLVSSAPSDNWVSPDGQYYYQIYPNASKMIAYKINKDGSLKEVDTQKIPYTSPQGMTGM